MSRRAAPPRAGIGPATSMLVPMDVERIVAAVKEGDVDTVSTMITHRPELATHRTEDGVSILMLALYHGHESVADALCGTIGQLDVFEAAARGDVAGVTAWLDEGETSVDASSPDGFTLLSLAAFFGCADVVALLLERGADVNAASSHAMGVGPLHAAIARGDVAITRRLLEAGADAQTPQAGGVTPLHGAASRGSRELVELLLDAGASRDARMEDDSTPADVARQRGHDELAEWLAQA